MKKGIMITKTNNTKKGGEMKKVKMVLCVILTLLSTLIYAGEKEDSWQPTKGWYTLHHDVQRTGRCEWGPDLQMKKIKKLWHREFWEEMCSPEMEPIIAEDLCFFGTFKGTFYAMNAYTGEDVWKMQASGGFRHSPSYYKGNIYMASMGNRNGGSVFCYEAKTGKKIWEFKQKSRGGFCVSPTLYKDKVFIGGRDNIFYCLNAKTGKEIWRFDKAENIYQQSPAIKNNRLYIAADDMVPRCLDTETGKLIWEAKLLKGGKKMESDSVRFYYPIIWNDKVIFRTCADDTEINKTQAAMIDATETARKMIEIRERSIKEKKNIWNPKSEYQKFYTTKWNRVNDKEYKQDQEACKQAVKDSKVLQTFYAIDMKDGVERLLTSIMYSGSENGYSTPTPGCIDFDGNLYVLYKTVFSQWEYPIRFFDCLGYMDKKSLETGIPVMLPKLNRYGKEYFKSTFPITSDEVNIFTIGGDKLYGSHRAALSYYDFKTKRVIRIMPKGLQWGEPWAGLYLTFPGRDARPLPWGAMMNADGGKKTTARLEHTNEWNGTSRGSMAIYKDKMWFISGAMVVCLQGELSENDKKIAAELQMKAKK